MSPMIELTDQLLDRALWVGDVPVPADLAGQVQRAVGSAPAPRRRSSLFRSRRIVLLIVTALLVALVAAVLAIGANRDDISQPRTLAVEVDRGTDPTQMMPVAIRDESGLLVDGVTMDRFSTDWLDALVDEVSPPGRIDPENPPIGFANPPGDGSRVIVMFLADGLCDDALDLTIAREGPGLRVAGVLVGRPGCGSSLGPMWFALDFSEPVSADAITGNLTRKAAQTPGPSSSQ